jgi:hypothetical protein
MSAKPINIASAVADAVKGVTREWAKQRRSEERDKSARLRRDDRMIRRRRITIRDAAEEVMVAAYNAASDNGTLPTRPRQIMYAARPKILLRTGKSSLDDRYFTQTLLPDFVERHPQLCESWDVVWDARGHFTEPHTGQGTALGTLEVRGYLGLRAARDDEVVTISDAQFFPTHGPEHRFSAVLFIEKEGFDPLLEAARIAQRFDLAVASTKGMSVTACRLLFDRLSARGVEKILVLHDFDVSGFSIFGTLGTDSRRYHFRNKIPVVDIGLRLADVDDMDLQDEPVIVKGDWGRRARTLRRHGATAEEIEFLESRRVELNAMPSRTMVDFIEAKLAEHGIKKLIPAAAVIEEHARRLLERRYAEETIAPLRNGIAERAAKAKLPAFLARRIAKELQEHPELPWDVALAHVLQP